MRFSRKRAKEAENDDAEGSNIHHTGSVVPAFSLTMSDKMYLGLVAMYC